MTRKGRPAQAELIEDPLNRDLWLAGEVDEVEGKMARIETRLTQIFVAVVGLLVTVVASLTTAFITGAGPL